ncbi:hypothetical protein SLE2022_100610 [Rubroshorea leprosula]
MRKTKTGHYIWYIGQSKELKTGVGILKPDRAKRITLGNDRDKRRRKNLGTQSPFPLTLTDCCCCLQPLACWSIYGNHHSRVATRPSDGSFSKNPETPPPSSVSSTEQNRASQISRAELNRTSPRLSDPSQKSEKSFRSWFVRTKKRFCLC